MLCTLLPLILGLGSALLGGLIGWYLFKNRKWLPYQQAIDEQTLAYDALNTTYNTLNTRYAAAQSNLAELQKSHIEWENRYHTLNNDHLVLSGAKRSLANDFESYKAEVESTEEALQNHLVEMDVLIKQRTTDWEAKIAQSNEQLALSDAKLKALSVKADGFNKNFDDLQQKNDALQVEANGYVAQITKLNHTVEDLKTDINFEKQRVAALEASDKENQATIQGLENHVSDITTQLATLQVAHNDLKNLVTALNTSHASEKQSWESQLVTLTNSHASAVAEHENTVNHHTFQLRDWERKHNEAQTHIQHLDLLHNQKIGEISVMRNENERLVAEHHKTAEHLHETRAHLHKLQTRVNNYELLVSDLEAELARLRDGGKTLVVETPAETVNQVQEPDKLEIVEGIGPKIAGLLKNAGIYTFLQLSEASFDTLKHILDNAGARFRMHDPHTWPAQAAMAHKGDWDELKVYQNHLKGGRENG